MIAAQLADANDVVGRLQAVAMLKDKKDHESIAQLKTALNRDPFYGVRVEAAAALASIHTDESLEAILASMTQPEARVRNAEAAALAAFYNDAAFVAETKAVAMEKNPDIQAQYIKGLANDPKSATRDLLLSFLQSSSYRHSVADAAIAAMQVQDDTAFLAPIQKSIQEQREDFTTRGLTAALDTVAFLARHEEKKDQVLQFLSGFVNDKNVLIRTGAIKALGTLQDPRALPLLQTFASAGKTNPEQPVAQAAMDGIRAARPSGDNLKELRETILNLQKENSQMRKDLDDLQKKLNARPIPRSSNLKPTSNAKP
jgi:aminopeptidase N